MIACKRGRLDGHRNLLVTHNLSDGKDHHCQLHPRCSVHCASGFVLTGHPDVMGTHGGVTCTGFVRNCPQWCTRVTATVMKL